MSQSSIARKLRLAAGHKVAVLNAPTGYVALLSPGPADIATEAQSPHGYVAIDDKYTALRFKRG